MKSVSDMAENRSQERSFGSPPFIRPVSPDEPPGNFDDFCAGRHQLPENFQMEFLSILTERHRTNQIPPVAAHAAGHRRKAKRAGQQPIRHLRNEQLDPRYAFYRTAFHVSADDHGIRLRVLLEAIKDFTDMCSVVGKVRIETDDMRRQQSLKPGADGCTPFPFFHPDESLSTKKNSPPVHQSGRLCRRRSRRRPE